MLDPGGVPLRGGEFTTARTAREVNRGGRLGLIPPLPGGAEPVRYALVGIAIFEDCLAGFGQTLYLSSQTLSLNVKHPRIPWSQASEPRG
jgi:hypothetical protein